MALVDEGIYEYLQICIHRYLHESRQSQDEVNKCLDSLGFRVGYQLIERMIPDTARLNDDISIMKYICKEFWTNLFSKQIDNLRTNNSGIFVLQDNNFRLVSQYSPTENEQTCQNYLSFVCGLLRGVLANFGYTNVVTFDIKSFPCYLQYKGPYPIDQIKLSREQLKNDLVDTSCKCVADFHLRLKLGIVTDEIVGFFTHNKVPDGLPDKLDLSIGDDDIQECFLTSDTEDRDRSTCKNLVIEIDQTSTNVARRVSTSSIDQTKSSLEVPVQKLKLEHGCQEKFCPRDLKVKEKAEPMDILNLVFCCDICFKMTGSRSSMEEHLKGENHFSASEYLLENEAMEIASPCSQSPASSSSQLSLCQSDRKVAYLKKRSLVVNLQASDKFAVFCPKPECRLFTSTSILVCALHYKYAHTNDKNTEIYSIGELKRIQELDLGKKHECPQCGNYHSKLGSLAEHLSTMKHFPHPAANEINVFVCPFDKCSFKSETFFTFKKHILMHNYFNSGGERLMCKIHVYTAPERYYHVTRFGENSGPHEMFELEREAERNALGDLIKVNTRDSSSPTIAQLNMILKKRKDELDKLAFKK